MGIVKPIATEPKKNRDAQPKKVSKMLQMSALCCKLHTTTDLNLYSNGFNQLFTRTCYICDAGRLFHWNRGLSLFLAFRFFYALAAPTCFLLTSNNDTK